LISVEDAKFRKLSVEEISKYVKPAKPAKE
jgi:hypothetical protein